MPRRGPASSSPSCTLDRSAADPAVRAGVDAFLAGYNGVLRDLARTDPSRFFFLPAPRAYDGAVTWRDALHETAAPLMDEYDGVTPAGALDTAGTTLLAQTGACGLTADARFGAERNSEVVTLIAYLQDFRRSSDAARWSGIDAPTAPGGLISGRALPCPF
ncbi:hypothetical protein ACE2AJ_17640 [Aquihabitans daechungensis]|uniref:hypothetical protein n=1 Tax=Aquihabitans daechungensis TaxID=1052257 RepID=UPI003B9DFEA5